MTTLCQRLCLVALKNKEDKIRITKNKSKLTGTTMYTDSDYTLKEHQIQRNIRKRLWKKSKNEVTLWLDIRK